MRTPFVKVTDYVAGLNIDTVKKKYGLRRVVKLASNENAFGVPPRIIRTLRKHLKNIHLYPDQHYQELKRAVSRNLGLEPENVLLGNGSDEVFDLVFKVLIRPKDRILTFYPSYSLYRILCEIYQARTVYLRLKDFQYDIRDIIRRLTPGVKMVVLANPNNPTGTYLKHDDMEMLIRKLSRNTFLLVDEAYAHYARTPDFPRMNELMRKYSKKNIILCRTFSKIYSMAGLRLGAGIGPPDLIRVMNRIRPPFNVNCLAEKAALCYLKDDSFIRDISGRNQFHKDFFYRELDKAGLSYIPSAANFIFIRLPVSGKTVSEELLKRGIIIRRINEKEYDRYIRVTIGKKGEIKKFIRNIREILKKY